MIDVKLLDTDEGVYVLRKALQSRGAEENRLDDAIFARREVRTASTELQTAKTLKNELSRQYGQSIRDKVLAEHLKPEIDAAEWRIHYSAESEKVNNKLLQECLAGLPNIPLEYVPVGDEISNRLIARHTDIAPTTFDFTPKDHVEIGTRMGCMNFEQATKMSGTRFVVLSGALAKLERVLGQWMLDGATKAHYLEMSVPHLVKADAMFGTGQLPKFEEDLFRAGDHYLIPTAEVSLTNYVRDRIIEIEPDAQLSMRMCALTPCYRAEAGSAGRDTRGLLRTHQFNKVELVSICDEHNVHFEHEEMLKQAQSVLDMLELPSRTVLLATGDMGFSSMATYDLEVWIPSEEKYREIASISYCGDFQARRMNARWKVRGSKGTEFVHTLNGSGVAVGRALLAVIENYQTEQGGIAIPMVLRERMGGSFIAPDGKII